ncbi:MAG: MerR family transcriptional regulator [Chloroflexi bacterium]|nr:MerR family transcriptional regulator [Chloroflexota bacterium]
MNASGRTPGEVARELGVSGATLRRWARRFSNWLSPSARRPRQRQYTDADIVIFRAIKGMLQEGLTYEEVEQRLARLALEGGEGSTQAAIAVAHAEDETATDTLALPEAAIEGELEVARLITETLSSISGQQQMVITGQQTMRQLLGVVLQDNFNLKEENIRLRERILETERKLYELKREMAATRSEERERMRQMESYLFELQRRLDLMTARPAASPQPALPTATVASSPPLHPPEKPSSTSSSTPSSGPEAAKTPVSSDSAASPPPKPGLWQRFLHWLET